MAIAELPDVEPVPDPAAELAALVAAQAADDATDRAASWRVGGRPVVRESELAPRGDPGWSLDRIAARRSYPERPKRGFVLLLGCAPWEGLVSTYVDRGDCECPVCGGRPRWGELCTYCCRCDLDAAIAAGRVRLDGLAVDAAPNHEYIKRYGLAATKHRAGKLKGGVGSKGGRK